MEPQIQQNKSSIGSIIGTVIIIAIIILGGLYFWGKRIEEARIKKELTTEPVTTEETENIQSEEDAINKTSGGDDLNSIENDLNNTNTTNLDAELEATLE